MKWVYDLTESEIIIKDIPIYSAGSISAGQMVMVAASTLFSAGADGGYAAITAAPDTVGANQCINALGICTERATTAGTTGSTVSIAANHNVTTGIVCYGKVIINPFSIYRAEVTTADQLTIGAGASSGTQQFTIAANGTTGNFNGQFVYFSNSAGPNYGQFRRIITSASAATHVLDAVALATITSVDKIVAFGIGIGKAPQQLSSDGISISQCSTGTSTGSNLRVVDTWVDKGAGIERANNLNIGGGRCNLGSVQAKITHIYQDIMMKDHAFGVDL